VNIANVLAFMPLFGNSLGIPGCLPTTTLSSVVARLPANGDRSDLWQAVAPRPAISIRTRAEWCLRHQGGSLLTGGRPIAQLSKERLSELSPSCERCLDAWATAAQRDPHASSQAPQQCRLRHLRDADYAAARAEAWICWPPGGTQDTMSSCVDLPRRP
jgi:hypothetical protein